MTKRLSGAQIERAARAKRSSALAREELRQPSSPRVAAPGPTSFALKARDPETDELVAAFLAGRETR